MKQLIIAGLMLLLASLSALGQSVRKDYREMTSEERLEYRAALMEVQQEMKLLGCLHNSHFTGFMNVHGDEAFLPWHRWFQYEFEKVLRSAPTPNATRLSVPYWNWITDTIVGQGSWNEPDFLGNLGNGWHQELKRDRMQFPTGGYGYSVNLAFASNEFLVRHELGAPTGFSGTLESIHGGIHGYVSGMMFGGYAPYDPVFYFHHGFVDKLWQDWEEQRPGQTARSVFSSNMLPHHDEHYECELYDSVNVMAHHRPHTPFINPVTTIDSRNLSFGSAEKAEVWYAQKGVLLLDGLGSNFTTSSEKARTYCYVAAQPDGTVSGSVQVGDVKFQSGQVLPDNKGGFIIGENSRTEIHTAKSIVFHPGFSTSTGSVLTASLVNGSCFTPSGIQARRSSVRNQANPEETLHTAPTWNVFPNPVSEGVVSFGKTAAAYSLTGPAGETVRSGFSSDHLDFNGIGRGIYLLNLDGDVHKIVVK